MASTMSARETGRPRRVSHVIPARHRRVHTFVVHTCVTRPFLFFLTRSTTPSHAWMRPVETDRTTVPGPIGPETWRTA